MFKQQLRTLTQEQVTQFKLNGFLDGRECPIH